MKTATAITPLRALNRFGLGAGRGEAQRLTEPREWLVGQLVASNAPIATELDVPSDQEIADVYREQAEGRRARDQEVLQASRRRLRDLYNRESVAVLEQRIATRNPFLERLVAFWSNHLCVSVAGKFPVLGLAGRYEREVIRPHVLGSFEEMVLASAKHPAMLLYLDNLQSIGPNSRGSRFAARRGRERGLNENYARELLELHTVGVNGGYSQGDVEELAKALTGWTLTGLGDRRGGGRPGMAQRGGMAQPPSAPGRLAFAFQEVLHEPGARKVMGREYPAGGVGQAERIIRDLCRRPETAQFIATKLAVHFVADVPPPSAVERIAKTFERSRGDLLAVSRELVDLPEAGESSHRKFRTPQEWLIAVFRALRTESVPQRAPAILQQLRHPFWAPPAPKGYGDGVDDWADPDGLMNRAELVRSMVDRGPREPPAVSWLLDCVELSKDDPLIAMVEDERIPARERMALTFAGPAFHWR